MAHLIVSLSMAGYADVLSTSSVILVASCPLLYSGTSSFLCIVVIEIVLLVVLKHHVSPGYNE